MATRKLVRFLCSLMLLLGLLVGCGSPSSSNPTTPTETQAPDELAGGEKITLVFSDWHLTEKHWEAALIKAIEQYEQAHPNIDVQFDYVSYGDKDTKYATQIEAGLGPDVLHLHAYSLRSFIQQGYLLSLDPFVEEEGGQQFLNAWYPQTLELMKDEQQYYAIPGDFMSMALFYNAKLFEEAELDPSQPPRNWSEFLKYAKKLTRDRDGDGQIDTWGFGTPAAVDPGFELRFSPFLYSYGASYLNEDQTCSALNTRQAREAFTYFVELATVHEVIPPGVTNQTAGTVRQQMANEQIAMGFGSGWTVPIIDSLNPELKAEEVIRVAEIPVAEGAYPEHITAAWLSAWSINKNSKHPNAAWDLIKFITAKEQEQQWFDDAGVTSARQDVSTQYEPLLNNKVSRVIAQQLDKAKLVPQIKEWPEVIGVVNRAAQYAISKARGPEEALRQAHNQINSMLSTYRTDGQGCADF